MIVARPALAANSPCAVPCNPAGARAPDDGHPADEDAREPDALERRDRARARPGPRRPRPGARVSANASVPRTTSRSVPNRLAMRGKAYIIGTSMAAPTAQAIPTSPGLPPRATIWIE